MEKLKQSAAAKVIAVILTAVMLASSLMLIVLSIYMLSHGYYTSPYSEILEEVEHDCSAGIYNAIANEVRGALYRNNDITTDEIADIISSMTDERNFKAEVWIGTEKVCGTSLEVGADPSRYSAPIGYTVELFHNYVYSSSMVERFGEDPQITIQISVDRSYPYTDTFSITADLSKTAYSMRWSAIVLGLLSSVLSVITYVFALSAAGHRRGVEGFYVSMFDRTPLDLLLVITAVAVAFETAIISDLLRSNWIYYTPYYNYYADDIAYRVLSYAVIWLFLFADGAIFTLLSMTVASRIKSGITAKYNLITYFCRAAARGIRFICRAVLLLPIVWRALLGSVATALISLYLFITAVNSRSEELVLFLLIALWCAVTGYSCYRAYCMRRLRLAGKRLATGDLAHRVNTAHLHGDYRLHAEDLNNIGVGMANAVEERMKSERFKTELITNVSHDIKTPLTSIINYIDLLKTPGLDEQTERGYIEILDRQAGKLRRLTEDLIEASKASSGALPVSLSPCDLSVLVAQMAGEYEERLMEHDLTLIVKKPDFPVNVMADGRHTARIFDNLMSNVSKYSLPGTRVYLELRISGDFAAVSLRNISREPIDMSPDELTERFVRGDTSRHTDGSGLGLSIARSLAELQGGALAIDTEGDLFRATLWFKVIQ